MTDIPEETWIEPTLLKAGDRRVLINGTPVKVDCRIVAEDQYQRLLAAPVVTDDKIEAAPLSAIAYAFSKAAQTIYGTGMGTSVATPVVTDKMVEAAWQVYAANGYDADLKHGDFMDRLLRAALEAALGVKG